MNDIFVILAIIIIIALLVFLFVWFDAEALTLASQLLHAL